MKVVKITKNYFELEDGRKFNHISELEEVPSLEDFQKIFNLCEKDLKDKINQDYND